MLFMNDWDIENALRRVQPDTQPNLTSAVVALANLAAWANANSDGWHSWPKPCRAAKALQTLIQGAEKAYRSGSDEDVTAADVKKALAPVKAFLTRQSVSHDVLDSFVYRVTSA